MHMKKGKEKFDALVAKCISRAMMPRETIRRFSKRAREYMVAYKAMESSYTNDDGQQQSISHQRIERMKKALKNHRAAIDFDKSFVLSIVQKADFDFDREINRGEKRKRKSLN